MFKLLLLIVCTTAVAACAYAQTTGFASPALNEKQRSLPGIAVKRTSLIARSETLPPIGAKTGQNHPAKSAAVFVELENLQQTDVRVEIQKIEIRSQISQQLELIDQTPKNILLRPLQSSIRDFHLTQPGTYANTEKVMAVVTLRVNGQTQVVKSPAIAVQPY